MTISINLSRKKIYSTSDKDEMTLFKKLNPFWNIGGPRLRPAQWIVEKSRYLTGSARSGSVTKKATTVGP